MSEELLSAYGMSEEEYYRNLRSATPSRSEDRLLVDLQSLDFAGVQKVAARCLGGRAEDFTTEKIRSDLLQAAGLYVIGGVIINEEIEFTIPMKGIKYAKLAQLLRMRMLAILAKEEAGSGHTGKISQASLDYMNRNRS